MELLNIDKYASLRDELDEAVVQGRDTQYFEKKLNTKADSFSSEWQWELQTVLGVERGHLNCHGYTFGLGRSLSCLNILREYSVAHPEFYSNQKFVKLLIEKNYLVLLEENTLPEKDCIVLYSAEPAVYIANTFAEIEDFVRSFRHTGYKGNLVALVKTPKTCIFETYILKLGLWESEQIFPWALKKLNLTIELPINICFLKEKKGGLIRISNEHEYEQNKNFIKEINQKLEITWEENVTYSGIVEKHHKSVDRLLIKSKWGIYPVFSHFLWQVPVTYGLKIKFYKAINLKEGEKHYLEYVRPNLQKLKKVSSLDCILMS